MLIANQVAEQLYESLVDIVVKLEQVDPDLARRVLKTKRSVLENTSEGAGRFKRDRVHFFEIAYASGKELETQLKMARMSKRLTAAELAKPVALLDRLGGLLWGLVKPRR